MPRAKKNTQLQKEMSKRLKHLVTNCLGISIEQCSTQMGYANSSVLRKAMAGNCFIDPEKLNSLALIVNIEGMSANIHWIITGDGAPMLKKHATWTADDLLILSKLDALPSSKKAALITLIN